MSNIPLFNRKLKQNCLYHFMPFRSKLYSIEIKSWYNDYNPDTHGWNIYVYFWDITNMPDTRSLPFHRGATYLHKLYDATGNEHENTFLEDQRPYIKVGNDFMHYGDDYVQTCNPKDGIPAQVMDNAIEIHDYLQGFYAARPQLS